MARSFTMVGGGFLGGLALAGLMAFAAQDAPARPDGANPPAVNPNQPAQARPAANIGDILVQQLKGVEGCHGVESANLASGKAAIIAWFENAEAAKRWYYHPMHQRLMFTGNQPGDAEQRKPLEHVEPDIPIMVIACITFSDRPEIPGVPMPISQISIEMYTPLPGGASINGRLTPEAINIEHMRKITPGR